MRGPIVCASLIAYTALFPPQIAAGEEPTGRIVRAPQSPNTVGWTTRAHDNPSIPSKRSVKVPSVEAPGKPPLIGGHAVGSPGEIAITVTAQLGGCDTIPAEVDEGAFLRPTWDRGFWVMPPGGLTRFLIPARTFINPDETLAPGPVVVIGATRRMDLINPS